MNKEYTLKFLQQRGIDIASLDIAGVLEWGKNCRQAYEEGFAPPSASFTIDAFSASITYESGSGRTKIVIPLLSVECAFYSLEGEGVEHINKLRDEILQLIEDETLHEHLGIRDVEETSAADKIIREWIELAIHMPTRLTQGW